jgi:hypothetical protein
MTFEFVIPTLSEAEGEESALLCRHDKAVLPPDV